MKDIPAFPVNPDINITLEPRWAGMTLRDYFAAKAMQPLMSHSGGYWDEDNLYGYAFMAYKMADAMLKARGE